MSQPPDDPSATPSDQTGPHTAGGAATPGRSATDPPKSRGGRATAAGALLAAVVLTVVGATGYLVGAQAHQPAFEPGETTVGDVDDAEEALEPVAELYAEIVEQAVEVPPEEELVEGAMEGMLDTLDDDYAQYVPAEGFEAFQDQVRGEFSGVGMGIDETPEGAVVRSVFPDTPAEEAGIEPGELIVRVDGDDVTEVPVDEISRRVQGEPGTEVTLGLRDEEGEERELTLERAEISIPTVEVEIEDGVGVVSMMTFTQQTGEQFVEAVGELEDAGVEALLLDLRDNGGGTLNEALDVLDALLDGGPVLSIVEAQEEEEVEASEGATDLPMAVMVNEGSASASEVVAGALQERGRAELIGTTTFGKGTIQIISQFSEGSGAKFTTAEFFLPSGEEIEGVGLEPDQPLAADDPDEQLAEATELLRQKVAGQGARADGD